MTATWPPEQAAFDRHRASVYISVSVRLLDELAKAGTIKRIKIGRKSLFRKVDLDAYLAKLAGEVPNG